MISIRPYVEIREGIVATSPALLTSLMKGLVVGPAMDEFHSYDDKFNFSSVNNVAIAQINDQIGDNGKYFDIAGARENTTVDLNSIEWGAKKAIFQFDFGDNDLKGHVKDKDNKQIFVQETGGDGEASEDDLINQGLQIGDTLRVYDPSDDSGDTYADLQIRSFSHDDDGNLQILLWDEIPYDVDETDSLKADVRKEFSNIDLTAKEYTYEKSPYSGTSVLIKNKGSFVLDYFVYKPSQGDATLNNILVSKQKTAIPNYEVSSLNAKAVDGFLVNFFNAFRTDLTNEVITVNYNDYKSKLGEPSDRNKLGTAIDLIAKEIPGFEMRVFVTESDSDDAYFKALNMLVNTTNFYSITPLTSSPNVIEFLNKTLKQSSDPITAAFKMGVAALRLPILSQKYTSSTYDVSDKNDDGTYTITFKNGGLSASNIVEGDYIFGNKDIRIAEEEYYNYIGETYTAKAIAKVTTVVTDKKIIVSPVAADIKVDESLDGQDVVIGKLNSKDQMVKELRNTALKKNNMHLVLTFPDKVVKDNKIYAGYYLAAVIQAVMAHLPPQQGLSNTSIGVFDRVINSSYFFTETELDDIASAGVTVVAQKTFDEKPYIIRQLTTEMNSLEEMEINKVRCLDYVALAVKKSVDGYVGKRNVTSRNQDEIEVIVKGLLDEIISDTDNPLLGSIITSYENLIIVIPDNDPGSIEGSVEVTTPTSLNSIKLGVKSKS